MTDDHGAPRASSRSEPASADVATSDGEKIPLTPALLLMAILAVGVGVAAGLLMSAKSLLN